MNRGLTILLFIFATVAFAECPPEAVPGTCIQTPIDDLSVIVQERVQSQMCCDDAEKNSDEDIAKAMAALAREDYQTAFSMFKSLAKAGNFIAQQNLGVMYTEGLGVAKNLKKASYWFEKSKPKETARQNSTLCANKRAQKG